MDIRDIEAAMARLDKARKVVSSFRLPLTKWRKFESIFDAIEMQIEEGEHDPAVVDSLTQALLRLADSYGLGEKKPKLEAAMAEFLTGLAHAPNSGASGE